ncbi:MAG TPA: diguanylate cyclase [Thermoanaerobaculia bacterium]|jgi:diguanylate cyclase (GGDEF)-like protein
MKPPLRVDLVVLNEIARIATQDLELRPMLQRITDTLAHTFDWQFVALITISEDRKSFVCEAVTSSMPTFVHVGYSRPLGSGVVGEVAATGKPMLLDDVRAHENYIETLPGALSELCVPLFHASQLVAILNLESTRLAAFHDQMPLLLTVADQIAPAIANARLYSELKQRASLMEMMSELSRTALEATDLDHLIERVVAYIKERFPIDVTATLGSAEAATTQFDGPSLAVPIVHHGATLGALRFEAQSSDVFTPANVLAFEAIADQIAGAINLASIRRDLETANAHLQRLSMLDGLTGVANRRRFNEALDVEWRRGIRSKAPLSLLMIDIDTFKRYNDAHGHQAGDECLCLVGATLQESLHRAGDLVARYGGEEFAVLLPETDAEHALRVAEILRERVAAATPVTISVGVSTITPDLGGASFVLVADADAALYEAKRRGRNRVGRR